MKGLRALLLLLPVAALAQLTPPLVQNRDVTFRVKLPGAKRVYVVIQGESPVEMQHVVGTWEAKVKDLPPQIYPYKFLVDGVAMSDPSNSQWHQPMFGSGDSLFTVRGTAPMPWDRTSVAHGVVHSHRFASELFKDERQVMVYTPPGYERGRDKYPVLYLLHGVNDTELSWSTTGRVPEMLDNLIQSKLAHPMIVVMPLGYGFSRPDMDLKAAFGTPKTQREIMDGLDHHLETEVRPLVEKLYRTRREARHRAIAGLSMGGSQALVLGMRHPDIFGDVTSMSGAFIMFGPDVSAWIPKPDSSQKLRLMCGKRDFLWGTNLEMIKALERAQTKPEWTPTEGGHTWMVWREHLIELLPKLFRNPRERSR